MSRKRQAAVLGVQDERDTLYLQQQQSDRLYVFRTPLFTLTDNKAVLQTSQPQYTASNAGYANLNEEI
jgi:hypothetical protein